MSRIRKFLYSFCQETSLHGFNQIVAPKRHWFERVFWTLIVAASATFCLYVIGSSYDKYYTNPIITSLDKEYKKFHVSPPAVTMVFLNPIKEIYAEQTIKSIWNVTKTEEESYDYYWRFLDALTRSNIQNISDFSEFANDKTLHGLDLAYVALNVTNDHKVSMTILFDALRPTINKKYHFNPYDATISEFGAGISVFGSVMHQAQQSLFPNRTLKKLNAFCYNFEEFCSAEFQSDQPVTFFLYSSIDLPDFIDQGRLTLKLHQPTPPDPTSFEAYAKLSTSMITSDEDIRSLTLQQRKCYFTDEQIFGTFKGYGMGICRSHCRWLNFVKRCGCAPFFYPKFDTVTPICNVGEMACVRQHAPEILKYSILQKGELSCNCLPACTSITFTIVDYTPKERYIGDNIARSEYITIAEIAQFEKFRAKRQIIFGISDLLVNFGGTAGLFLGCSVITLVETAYFFTLGAIKFFYRNASANLQKRNLQRQLHRNHRIYARFGINELI